MHIHYVKEIKDLCCGTPLIICQNAHSFWEWSGTSRLQSSTGYYWRHIRSVGLLYPYHTTLYSETILSFRPLNWLSGIPWKVITWQLLNLFVELLIYVHVKIRSKYAIKYKVGKSEVYMSCKNNSTFFGSDEYLNVVNCMSLVELRQNSVDTDVYGK